MALLKIFKPKWQHKNVEVRLDAVEKISAKELDILVEIVRSDSNEKVRQAALDKLTDVEVLESLLDGSQLTEFSTIVNRRITELRKQAIFSDLELPEKQNLLEKIDDSDSLAALAINAPETLIRLQAIAKIEAPATLLEIVSQNCGKEPGLAAIDKIKDLAILKAATVKASNKAVRAAAEAKINELSGPSPEQLKAESEKQGADILLKATELLNSPDPQVAQAIIVDLRNDLEKLADKLPVKTISEFDKIAVKVKSRLEKYLRHAEESRQKQEALEKQFTSLKEITARIIRAKENNLIDLPELLPSLNNEWDNLAGNIHPASLIPEDISSEYLNENRIAAKISRKIIEERRIIEDLKEKLSQAQSMIDEGAPDKGLVMLSALRDQIEACSLKYLSYQEIQDQISTAIDQCHSLAEQQKEKYQAEINDNFNLRLQLLAEVKELTASDNKAEAEKRVKEIKQLWSAKIPLPDDFTQTDQLFNEALIEFNLSRQTYYQQKDWQLWSNKNLKEGLIDELKSLNDETNLHLVFKELKKIQKKWHEIGHVPPKDSQKLWSKFSKLCDSNFKRCQNFFLELDEIANQNLQKKNALVEQAESLKESTAWQKTADALKELQNQWKNIGRVAKDKEDEVHQRFRQACNYFFEARKNYYDEQDKKKAANLAEKERICQELEELIKDPSLSLNSKIQEFQAEWKTIGPSPKEKDNQVWTRFRTACDQYYDWLDQLKPANLELKENLCLKVQAVVDELKEDHSNLEHISKRVIDLQKQWKDIGQAPKGKNEEIWKKFRGICDSFFKVKKGHYQKIDASRPSNESAKLAIIEKIHSLSKIPDKKNVQEIIKLQEEWKKIGPATKNNESGLQKQFTELCNNFFKDRRQNFEELDRLRRENLKLKEQLCLRLELIAGIQSAPDPGARTSSLTLADQLKLAFETNFVMGNASDKDGIRRKKDELNEIQKEWESFSGDIPKEHQHYIDKRYQKALSACKKLFSKN